MKVCLSFLVVCCLAVISSAIAAEHPNFEASVLELLKGTQQQAMTNNNAAAFPQGVSLIDSSVNLSEMISR